jgi:hypothetical protein
MRRRLFCPLLAAAMLAVGLGGVPPPASAAIRIVISDGNPANDQVFYSQVPGFENQVANVFTSFDGYEILTSTTASNFPGNSTEGFLSQNVTVTDLGGGALSQLRVSTAIIPNLGFATGQVTGANAATVAGQAPLLFTSPADQFLSVTSRVNTLGATDTGALVQLQTVVNGGPPVTSMTTVDGSFNQTMGTATGQPGFTLVSSIVLTGAAPGITGLQLVGRSSVTGGLVPEPGPLALWGLGALGIVVAASGWRRRALTCA